MLLPNLLLLFSGKHNFVIVLDGLESVKPLSSSPLDNYKWLTAKLPPKAHILISIGNHEQSHDLFCKITERIPEENTIALPKLNEQSMRKIAQTHLQTRDRTLSNEQMEWVLDTSKASGNPLLLK